MGDKASIGFPVDSPGRLRSLLKLASRRDIATRMKYFPMLKINDALDLIPAIKIIIL